MRTDPERLFRDADTVQAPDLWGQIGRRKPGAPRPPRPLGKILTIVLAFAVATAGIGFALAALGRSPHRSPAPATSPEPSVVRPNVTTIGSVGAVPEAMAAADGAIWVSAGEGLAKIDPASNQVQVVSSRAPVDLAYGAGSLWADGVLDPSVPGNVVERLDPRSGKVLGMTPLDMSATLIAGDDQAVWVAGYAGSQAAPPQLERIDPATGGVVATVTLDGLDPNPPNVPFVWLVAGLEAGEGAGWAAVWETGNDHVYGGFLVRVDEATNSVSDVLPVGGSAYLAVGDGSVWTSDYRSSPPAVRIDAGTLQEQPFDAPNFEPFAVGEGGVWFLQRQNDAELVSRLDPATLTVDATIPIPFDPKVGSVQAYVLDPSSHTVWLAFEGGEVTRIDLYAACPQGFNPEIMVTPSQAAPEATITIAGPLGHYHEDGSYSELSDRVEAWWNLDPDRYYTAAPASTTPPAPAGPGPVLRLAAVEPTTDCSFSIDAVIPDVPPGTYTITLIEVGGDGSAQAGQLTFVVGASPAHPPATGHLVATTTRLQPGIRALTVAFGDVWVVNYLSLTRLDGTTGQVKATIPIKTEDGTSLAAAGGLIWVSDGRVSNGPRTITAVDPVTDRVVGTVSVPTTSVEGLAAAQGQLWASVDHGFGNGPASLLAIDPASDRVVKTLLVDTAGALSVAGTSLWIYDSNNGGSTLQFDLYTESSGIRLDGTIGDVAFAGGLYWSILSADPAWEGATTVIAVDPATGNTVAALPAPRAVNLAASATGIWVFSTPGSLSKDLYVPDPSQPATVSLIDPAARAFVGSPVPVDNSPARIAAGDDALWVSHYDSGIVTKVTLQS